MVVQIEKSYARLFEEANKTKIAKFQGIFDELECKLERGQSLTNGEETLYLLTSQVLKPQPVG